jgi:hypothetical protein
MLTMRFLLVMVAIAVPATAHADEPLIDPRNPTRLYAAATGSVGLVGIGRRVEVGLRVATDLFVTVRAGEHLEGIPLHGEDYVETTDLGVGVERRACREPAALLCSGMGGALVVTRDDEDDDIGVVAIGHLYGEVGVGPLGIRVALELHGGVDRGALMATFGAVLRL